MRVSTASRATPRSSWRTVAQADRGLRAGDRIYGTVRSGVYRRYAVTEVLDHWRTLKTAYRVLEDGTELVASGDHRFLTARGWKHVTGTECGRRAGLISRRTRS